MNQKEADSAAKLLIDKANSIYFGQGVDVKTHLANMEQISEEISGLLPFVSNGVLAAIIRSKVNHLVSTRSETTNELFSRLAENL